MDIKAKIDEIVEKVKTDPSLMEKFQANPVEAVEGLIGVDLPDDQVNQIVNGIKAKVAVDKVGEALGGLGGLFGKK